MEECIEKASSILHHNSKVLSESNFSLDFNSEKLELLKEMAQKVEDKEKLKILALLQELETSQSLLQSNFEDKLKQQTQLKVDLITANGALASKVSNLKDKDEEFSIISSLDRSSSIIYENEIQIDSLKRKMKEKQELNKCLDQVNREHEDEIVKKKQNIKTVLENQISYSEKKRVLDLELQGKKRDLNKASQSFRDLETGRFEQSVSPKSNFFFDQSTIRRMSPNKDSTFIDFSSPVRTIESEKELKKPENEQKDITGKRDNHTTLLLVGIIVLLLGFISKLLLS